uniref:Uncharacterized protein n=1 Tax=Parascaris equorum TaxID=6256 RepID=A0A914RF46_PAREQ
MVAVAPVNEIHSDAALVGVYLAANGGWSQFNSMPLYWVQSISPTLFWTCASLMGKYNVHPMSRTCAEVDALTACESSSTVAVDRAAQLLASGRTLSAGDFIQLIRNVTMDDINKVRVSK